MLGIVLVFSALETVKQNTDGLPLWRLLVFSVLGIVKQNTERSYYSHSVFMAKNNYANCKGSQLWLLSVLSWKITIKQALKSLTMIKVSLW